MRPYGIPDPAPLIDAGQLSCRQIDLDEGWIVVAAAGEVDTSTAPQLQSALISAIGSDTQVVVDLRNVGFLDSTGLSALITARQHAHACEADLMLLAPSKPVSKVLAITGLDRLFPIHDTVDDIVTCAGCSTSRSRAADVEGSSC